MLVGMQDRQGGLVRCVVFGINEFELAGRQVIVSFVPPLSGKRTSYKAYCCGRCLPVAEPRTDHLWLLSRKLGLRARIVESSLQRILCTTQNSGLIGKRGEFRRVAFSAWLTRPGSCMVTWASIEDPGRPA